MSGLRRIIGNTLISLFGQLVTWTSTLGLTIAYGRFLGDFKFGELYLALSIVSLIGFPVEYGFNQQLTRDVAEKPEKAHTYLWNTLLIKAVLWLLAYGVILLVVGALGYSQEQWTIVAICGVNLLSGSIVNAFAALHYAFERTIFPSVGMMLEKGLSAAVGFILLKNGASVQVMAYVLLGGSLVDALWVSFWFFRLVGWHMTFNMTTLRQLVQSSIPFVVYGVLGVIYYRVDTILLSLMSSTTVVGWYGAGYRLFETLLFIPNLILNAVMYPVFSKLANKSRETMKTAVEKCMNLLLFCSFPIAAFMIADASGIIGFLYHRSDFLNSVPVVQALAPGLIFLYINTLFSNIIVSTRGEKKIPLMAAAALVFNLGLNLFLIPHYQHIGAAVVTSLTELLLLCISLAFVPKYLLSGKSIRTGIKTLVAALLMGTIIFYLQRLSIFLLLPLGTLLYLSGIILLRTIPREDVQAILKAIKNKGSADKTLATIAEENIYAQITNPHLPAVTTKHALLAGKIEQITTSPLPSLQEDITLSLPSVARRKTAPWTKVEEDLVADDDEDTLHLAAIKIKTGSRKTLFQVEEDLAVDDGEDTLHLATTRIKTGSRKTLFHEEGS